MKKLIEDSFKEVGLPEEVIQPVLATFKLAYEFVLSEPEDYSKVGNSRLGGIADLPAHIPYPISKSGYLMQLIAQINLSELSEEVIPNLPKQGWLYFFQLSMEEFKVIYFDGSLSELSLSVLDSKLFAKYEEPFDSYKVDLKLIPTIKESLLNQLLDDYCLDKWDEYQDKLKDILRPKSLLGGNDQCIQVNSLIDALRSKGALSELENAMYRYDLHIDGNDNYPRFTYWDERLKLEPDDVEIQKIVKRNDDAIAYAPTFVKNREFYQKELSKWHLLFTIQSIDESQMIWSDYGLLTFCIHENDLLRRDFNNISISHECG